MFRIDRHRRLSEKRLPRMRGDDPDTAKKADVQRVILDNFENDLLNDETLISLLRRSRRFKQG